MFTNRTVVSIVVSAVAGVLLAIVIVPHAYSANNQDSLARLRAAFVYNISKFVTWPETDLTSPKLPFKICIMTQDDVELTQHFNQLQSKKTHGRSIKVSVFKNKQQLLLNIEEAGPCHILFISNGERSEFSQREITSLMQFTLLIGKNRHFLENGGMLSLIRVKSKIKIFINPEAIGQSQLKLESRLRSLAQTL